MKPEILIVGALLVAAAAIEGGEARAAAEPLSVHRWKDRLLVVFAPGADDPRLKEQQALLAEAAPELEERDVVVVTVAGDRADGGTDAATLRRQYRVDRSAFALVLIGKDGGEKARYDRPRPFPVVAATIDAMPMRRDEAAQRRR